MADDWVVSSEDEAMEEEEKVQVKFVTKLEQENWKAPESVYYVPLSLARYGLSEVLNNLLQLGTSRSGSRSFCLTLGEIGRASCRERVLMPV